MKNKIVYCLIISLLTNWAQAQKSDTTEFNNKNVLISTGYKPIIFDADKQSISPEIVEINKKERKFNYLVFPQEMKISRNKPENLPYVTIGKDKALEYFNSIAKIGIGSLINPDLHFNYGNSYEQNTLYGFNISHHSIHSDFDSEKSYNISSPYYHTSIGANFIKYRETNKLYTTLNYTNESYDFFGFNDQIDSIANTEHQTLHRLNWGLYFKSDEAKDSMDIKYNTAFEYKLLYSSGSNSENNIKIGSDLSKKFEKRPFDFLSSKYRYKGKLNFGIDFNNYVVDETFKTSKENNSLFKDSISTNSKINLVLAPSLVIEGEDNSLEIGFGINYNSGINKNKFSIFPKIVFNHYLYKDIMHTQIGIVGSVKNNSNYQLSQENRYINQVSTAESTISDLKIFGDINYTIYQNSYFRPFVSYEMLTNEYFFINDPIAPNKFDIVSDDAKLLKLGLDFVWNSSSFGFESKYWFQNYKTDKLKEAYHKASSFLDLKVSYSINDFLRVSSEFNLRSGIKAIDAKGNEKELKTYTNLNLKLDYDYWEDLSFYFAAQNILQQKTTIWNNYYRPSINLMIGMYYRF